MRSGFVTTLMLAMLAVSTARAQVLPGYEVVHITDNPNDYSSRPQINNCGEVVFSTRINQSEPGEEIFLYDNGRLIRLTNNDVRDAAADINDDGTVVWTHRADGFGGGEIVMLQGPLLRTVGIGNVPKINNLGHVAWKLFQSGGCASPSNIFFFDGETVQQITDDGLSNVVVRINNHDDLTWTRNDNCASPWWESDIMLYSDGVITQLTDGQFQPGGSCINDVGQVVWSSTDLDAFDDIVELWEDGVTTTVVDGGGAYALNNAGDIVFTRETEDGSQLWLYRSGESLQLTDEPFPNSEAVINEETEIAWQAKRFPESDIHLLRRIRTGEADFDGDIDLDDLAVLQDCVTGPGDYDHLCTCRFFDVDHDRDVDLRDFAVFQSVFTGENR